MTRPQSSGQRTGVGAANANAVWCCLVWTGVDGWCLAVAPQRLHMCGPVVVSCSHPTEAAHVTVAERRRGDGKGGTHGKSWEVAGEGGGRWQGRMP
eukprot:365698-Chlamydomonas_euryale.AAC.14